MEPFHFDLARAPASPDASSGPGSSSGTCFLHRQVRMVSFAHPELHLKPISVLAVVFARPK